MKLYKIKTSKSELVGLVSDAVEDDLIEGEMMLLTDDLSLFRSIALNKYYNNNLLKEIYIDSVFKEQITEARLFYLERPIIENTFNNYENKPIRVGNLHLNHKELIHDSSILLSEYIKDKYDDKDFEEHSFFGVYDFEYLDQVIDDCEGTGLPHVEIYTE